jgi:hypothetical protein
LSPTTEDDIMVEKNKVEAKDKVEVKAEVKLAP